MQSRYLFPFQSEYADAIAATEDVWSPYTEQDVDAARAILEENDAIGTDVRSATSRRTHVVRTQFALIIDSCGERGRVQSSTTETRRVLRRRTALW